ncbi:MAG: rRNA pseudouridine synthase, partial [Proteobacteria bacterium]|nr:rRNA pseudouridine synthase [Pseudomonadota bacterium]
MKTRIAKFIADSGVASRRDAERLIESGAVAVNGAKITTPVFFIDDGDTVSVNGKQIPASEKIRIFAFNKPIDTMTTARDPLGRKTIYDILPKEYKNLKYIGRLDYKTTGLILLTNNGDVARILTLPTSGIIREYIAKLHPKNMIEIASPATAHHLRKFLSPVSADDSVFDPLRRGITVDGMKYAPMGVDVLSRYPVSVRIKLREGKKNEIRIAFDAIGLPVAKLSRVSYGGIALGTLVPGAIRELSDAEVKKLLNEQGQK